jgi:Holliday junction resolvase RusA-like endonuclease
MRITKAQARALNIKLPGDDRAKKASARSQKGRYRVNDPAFLDQEPITFDVPLVSHVKERPRTFPTRDAVAKAFRIAQGNVEKFLGALKMSTYTPQATREFEKNFRTIAQARMAGRQPITGPVEINLIFLLPGDPDLWPTALNDGDLDNHGKAAWDGLNEIVFADDRTIVVQSSSMNFTDGEPMIRVDVRPARMPGRDYVPPKDEEAA